MGYEIQTLRGDGSIVMDGLSKGGILVGEVSIAAGNSGSQSFPAVPDASYLSWRLASGGGYNISLQNTTSNGQTCAGLSYSPTPGVPQYDTTIFVFASNASQRGDSYGINYVNNNGEALADQGFASPQWWTTLQFNAQADYQYTTADGYTARQHKFNVYGALGTTVAQGSALMLLLYLPDSGGNDTWYALDRCYVPTGSNGFTAILTVYTKAASYILPTMHIFKLSNPADSGNPYAIKLYDKTGKLTFDSTAETLSGRDLLNLNYPSYGNTNNYSLQTTGRPAIGLPGYRTTTQGGGVVNRYQGVSKRVGQTISSKLIQDASVYGTSFSNDPGLYAPATMWCPVSDASYQNWTEQSVAVGSNNAAWPSFTQEPTNQSVTVGATATFTCGMGGTPAPGIQWFKSGGNPIPGNNAQQASLVLPNCQLADNGSTIYAWAINSLGEVQSTSCTLYVNAPTTYPSYNNVSTSVTDTSPSFDVGRDGTTTDSLGNVILWANGTGDGTLYNFTATLSGAAAGPTSGDFASAYSATWTCNITNTKLGTGSGSVTVNIYLKSGGALVSTCTCSLRASPPA